MASAGRLSPAIVRCLSTRSTTSSLRDPNPNWSNWHPKETILINGCDFEHWLVVMEAPQGDITRDEIINSYIKTLATVVGRKLLFEKIQEVVSLLGEGCIHDLFAFLSVLAGEPFINGQVVPYDPKYHEEWIRNNSRANERNRRNDRPRNFDRSRNFERRRENMQNRDFQNTSRSPMPNQAGPNSGLGPANMGHPPPNRAPMPPPNMGPPNNYNNPQPSNNWNSGPPNSYNQVPPNSYNQMPPNNYNQMPPNNPGWVPPNNMAPPSNAGWNDPGQYQNNYTPDRDAGVNPGPNRY
ncbi:hypothetical protein EV2_031781 [Malus domestica]